MYSLYPNIVPKIKEKLKNLNLTLLTQEPEKLIKEKKRFYRAFCRIKQGEKVFLKSLLAKEKGIKNRFFNEINFAKTLKEDKNHPLYPFLAKTLNFSLNPSFPYILQEFLPGKARNSRDKFSLKEIKKIGAILKIINNSPFNALKLIPQKPIFNFSNYKKTINFYFKNIVLEKESKEKIESFVGKNKKLFTLINPVLSHGDFSEANLFFSKNKIKVIDWEHVHLRNPAYDFTEFWVKRRKNPKEQKILMEEFLKDFKEKEYFSKLFKLALIEICLRDLSLFQKAKIEKDKKEYLILLKKYI